MRRILPLLCFLGMSMFAMAQTIAPISNLDRMDSRQARTMEEIRREAQTMPGRQVTCASDTLWYARIKNSGSSYSGWFLTAANAQAAGQWFSAPSSVTITGAGFWAYVDTPAINADIRLEVYNAGANKLPVGAPVASKTVNFDTTGVFSGMFVDDFYKQIVFDAPVTVTGDYVITITNLSATATIIYYSGSATDATGAGEFNAMLRFGATVADWTLGNNIGIGGGAVYDVDHAIYPFVSFDYDVSFETDTCILYETPTIVTSTSDSILTTRYYNYRSYLSWAAGTADSTFFWDFDTDPMTDPVRGPKSVSNVFFPGGGATVPISLTGSIVPYSALFATGVNFCNDIETADVRAELAARAIFTVDSTGPRDFTFSSPFPNEMYMWDFGDGNTSTDPNPSHTYQGGSGTSTVTLITQTCASKDTFTVDVIYGVVGLDNLAAKHLAVYPNPTSGQLTVELELNSVQEVSIEVTDLMGRVVRTVQPTATQREQFQLNLDALEAGIYLVAIKAGDQRAVQRVILE